MIIMNKTLFTVLVAMLILGFASYKIYKMAAGFSYVEAIASNLQQQSSLINPSGRTVADRFKTPQGFERMNYPVHSFENYLQHLPLKTHGSPVIKYDGSEKWNKVHEAVIQMDVGKKDLQQCADAVMRLRAEYLYNEHRYNDISFNFTNGFKADYSKWREGQRIRVNGNNCSWYPTTLTSTTYSSFREYLDMVFSYAGTLSLSRQLSSKNLSDIKPGDVFIKGGSPGHAVIVVDVCKNKNGEKLFMLAQSYMPAQEIHILKNTNDTSISPWYRVKDRDKLYTPEWTFEWDMLKTF